jgi:hypothetical protein
LDLVEPVVDTLVALVVVETWVDRIRVVEILVVENLVVDSLALRTYLFY